MSPNQAGYFIIALVINWHHTFKMWCYPKSCARSPTEHRITQVRRTLLPAYHARTLAASADPLLPPHSSMENDSSFVFLVATCWSLDYSCSIALCLTASVCVCVHRIGIVLLHRIFCIGYTFFIHVTQTIRMAALGLVGTLCAAVETLSQLPQDSTTVQRFRTAW